MSAKGVTEDIASMRLDEGLVHGVNKAISAICDSALEIARVLKSADGKATTLQNASGDTQLKIDVVSDQVVEEALLAIPEIRAIVSEEKEGVVLNSVIAPDARLLIAYDPLDGSSLMDSNLSVGSIFGIYEGEFAPERLVASVYALYGLRLEVVISIRGMDVRHYKAHNILRPCTHYDCMDKEADALENFIYLGSLTLQNSGNINASGGTQRDWPLWHRHAIEELFHRGYRLRYSGGMVPDLHTILIKGGGLFSYPATSSAPEGKLRKLFEVYPFAFIYENAKGAASDGTHRLLEGGLSDKALLHESTPCYIGSRAEVELIERLHASAKGIQEAREALGVAYINHPKPKDTKGAIKVEVHVDKSTKKS